MAYAGYIAAVQLSDELSASHLAKLCRTVPAAHAAEIETAINDIIAFSEVHNKETRLAFVPEDPDQDLEDDRSNIKFKVSMSIDASRRSLVLNFSDPADGKNIHDIRLRFGDIRAGLDPYRKLIAQIGFCRFIETDTVEHAETLRAITHQDMLRQMGFSYVGYKSTLMARYHMSLDMARYIGTLISALFPKGPTDDWVWEAPTNSIPSTGSQPGESK